MSYVVSEGTDFETAINAVNNQEYSKIEFADAVKGQTIEYTDIDLDVPAEIGKGVVLTGGKITASGSLKLYSAVNITLEIEDEYSCGIFVYNNAFLDDVKAFESSEFTTGIFTGNLTITGAAQEFDTFEGCRGNAGILAFAGNAWIYNEDTGDETVIFRNANITVDGFDGKIELSGGAGIAAVGGNASVDLGDFSGTLTAGTEAVYDEEYGEYEGGNGNYGILADGDCSAEVTLGDFSGSITVNADGWSEYSARGIAARASWDDDYNTDSAKTASVTMGKFTSDGKIIITGAAHEFYTSEGIGGTAGILAYAGNAWIYNEDTEEYTVIFGNANITVDGFDGKIELSGGAGIAAVGGNASVDLGDFSGSLTAGIKAVYDEEYSEYEGGNGNYGILADGDCSAEVKLGDFSGSITVNADEWSEFSVYGIAARAFSWDDYYNTDSAKTASVTMGKFDGDLIITGAAHEFYTSDGIGGTAGILAYAGNSWIYNEDTGDETVIFGDANITVDSFDGKIELSGGAGIVAVGGNASVDLGDFSGSLTAGIEAVYDEEYGEYEGGNGNYGILADGDSSAEITLGDFSGKITVNADVSEWSEYSARGIAARAFSWDDYYNTDSAKTASVTMGKFDGDLIITGAAQEFDTAEGGCGISGILAYTGNSWIYNEDTGDETVIFGNANITVDGFDGKIELSGGAGIAAVGGNASVDLGDFSGTLTAGIEAVYDEEYDEYEGGNGNYGILADGDSSAEITLGDFSGKITVNADDSEWSEYSVYGIVARAPYNDYDTAKTASVTMGKFDGDLIITSVAREFETNLYDGVNGNAGILAYAGNSWIYNEDTEEDTVIFGNANITVDGFDGKIELSGGAGIVAVGGNASVDLGDFSGTLTVGKDDLQNADTLSLYGIAAIGDHSAGIKINTLSGSIIVAGNDDSAFGICICVPESEDYPPGKAEDLNLNISGTVSAAGEYAYGIVSSGNKDISVTGTLSAKGKTTSLAILDGTVEDDTSINSAAKDIIKIRDAGQIIGDLRLGGGDNALYVDTTASITGNIYADTLKLVWNVSGGVDGTAAITSDQMGIFDGKSKVDAVINIENALSGSNILYSGVGDFSNVDFTVKNGSTETKISIGETILFSTGLEVTLKKQNSDLIFEQQVNVSDLYVKSFTLSDPEGKMYFDTSDLLQYTVCIGNRGNAPATGTGVVSITVDGKTFRTEHQTVTAAGELVLTGTFDKTLSAGKHTITVKVDADDKFAEKDESNNVYTAECEIKPYESDLYVKSFTLSDPDGKMYFDTSDLLQYTVCIGNRSNAPATGTGVVSITVDGKTFRTEHQTVTAAGELVLTGTFDKTLSAGKHTVTVKVDADDKFAEKDESNNVYTAECEIKPYEPNSPNIPVVPPSDNAPKFTGAVTEKYSKYNMTLKWDKAVSANKSSKVQYYIQFDNNEVFVTKKNSYTVKNLTLGKHFYSIRAVDSLGNTSAWSEMKSFTVEDLTPPTVKISAASVNKNTLKLTWTGADAKGAIQSYKITVNNEEYTVPAEQNSFELQLNKSHVGKNTVTVTAFDGVQYSKTATKKVTVKDFFAPEVVTGVSAQVTNPAKYTVTLSWNPAVDNSGKIKSYEIKLSNGKVYTSKKNELVIKKMEVGDYTFSVRAVDAAKNPCETWSEEGKFTVNDVTAPAKVSVKATVTGNNAVISWKAPKATDIVAYEIKYANNSGMNNATTINLTSSDLSHELTGLAKGKWYVTVVAVDASGNKIEKPKAKTVNIKTDLPELSAVDLLIDDPELPVLTLASEDDAALSDSLSLNDDTPSLDISSMISNYTESAMTATDLTLFNDEKNALNQLAAI